MSTKSTIVYVPETGEHWYEELLPGDEGIVLCLNREHLIETDFDGACITIKSGSHLYNAFLSFLKEKANSAYIAGYIAAVKKEGLK